MNLDLYQEKSLETAIYPNQGNNLVYTILGIIEETGEALEKLSSPLVNGFLLELGDQLWYIANCCTELKIKMSSLEQIQSAANNDTKLHDSMIHHATSLAGQMKKIIRDDSGSISADRKERIMKSLTGLLFDVKRAAVMNNSSIEQVMEMNLKKLSERMNRNALKGSGDYR